VRRPAASSRSLANIVAFFLVRLVGKNRDLTMARRVSPVRIAVTTVVAWTVGFVIFFPILWTVLTSFKTELDAFSTPQVPVLQVDPGELSPRPGTQRLSRPRVELGRALVWLRCCSPC
jgi:ABC-type glycerol-3-phosphate transport system permease component